MYIFLRLCSIGYYNIIGSLVMDHYWPVAIGDGIKSVDINSSLDKSRFVLLLECNDMTSAYYHINLIHSPISIYYMIYDAIRSICGVYINLVQYGFSNDCLKNNKFFLISMNFFNTLCIINSDIRSDAWLFNLLDNKCIVNDKFIYYLYLDKESDSFDSPIYVRNRSIICYT